MSVPDLVVDPSILEGYLTDASNVRGHATGLFRPRTTAEVAAIVQRAQEEGVPLTVTARRTSTTAGPVPFGGYLLSTEHLCRVINIGVDTARVEAGAFLGAFQEELEARGRFFPPDPTSRHECSIGGIVACNASGARSFRYGPTRPWIVGLTVVLPDGSVRDFRRGDPIPEGWPVPDWVLPEVKTAAGYHPPADALDLFIGQEGTLGIITEVELRLTNCPERVFGLVAFFPDRASTLAFVRRASLGEGIRPRCIEYYDSASLDMIRARTPGIPDEAVAALFFEQETVDDEVDEQLGCWLDALEEGGALVEDTLVADDAPGRTRLHTLRHAIPAEVNERVVRAGMPKVGTDFSVPSNALEEIMDAYDAVSLETICFGHIGDAHLHLNMLPKSEEELVLARETYRRLALHAVRLGGSVSAEHGIGKIKRGLLAEMVGPEVLQDFRNLKAHLDPNWILGRGTLFDPPGGITPQTK